MNQPRMKQTFFTLTFFVLTIFAFGQNQNRRFNISGGGGFENYQGDLGKTFFVMHEEMYGFFRLSCDYYLNKSFDLSVTSTIGDFGHCRDWNDDPTNLDMRSRMFKIGPSVRYKFANGYLLKENSLFSPFIFAGASFINLKDVWDGERVNEGNYFSLDGGAGLVCNFTERYSMGYSLGFGYFLSDNLDYADYGSNDFYMQNSFFIGMNF